MEVVSASPSYDIIPLLLRLQDLIDASGDTLAALFFGARELISSSTLTPIFSAIEISLNAFARN